MLAAEQNSAECAKHLLAAGADMYEEDKVSAHWEACCLYH
jgi:hypothetical protein